MQWCHQTPWCHQMVSTRPLIKYCNENLSSTSSILLVQEMLSSQNNWTYQTSHTAGAVKYPSSLQQAQKRLVCLSLRPHSLPMGLSSSSVLVFTRFSSYLWSLNNMMSSTHTYTKKLSSYSHRGETNESTLTKNTSKVSALRVYQIDSTLYFLTHQKNGNV